MGPSASLLCEECNTVYFTTTLFSKRSLLRVGVRLYLYATDNICTINTLCDTLEAPTAVCQISPEENLRTVPSACVRVPSEHIHTACLQVVQRSLSGGFLTEDAALLNANARGKL